MYASLKVWLDGCEDPVTVKPITVDFLDYAKLLGKKNEPIAFELRLAVAYMHLESPDIASLADVREWGRRRSVIAEEVDDAPDPTRAGPSPA